MYKTNRRLRAAAVFTAAALTGIALAAVPAYAAPTPSPTPTATTTPAPSGSPSGAPSGSPSGSPSDSSSASPSGSPSDSSSDSPSGSPSDLPSGTPTDGPTGEPTPGDTPTPTETPTRPPLSTPGAAVTAPGEVEFAAAPGQANALRITADGPAVTFDDVHPIVPGAGCAAAPADATVVVCDLGAPATEQPIYVRLHDGNDTVTNHSGHYLNAWGGTGKDTLIGSATAGDFLSGEDGADVLHGRGGQDGLFGGGGADEIYGGDGDDTILGQSGDDRIHGDGGDDQLQGDAGRNVIEGGAGDDGLFPSGEGDVLRGGEGDDHLANDLQWPDFTRAADVLDGGPGRDEVNYGGRPTALHVDLGDPSAVAGEAGEGDSLIGVEDVVGGAANDLLIGNDDANRLVGMDGEDRLYGLGGDDVLDVGWQTRDAMDGGDDRDTCIVLRSMSSTVNCEDIVYEQPAPSGTPAR